MPLIGSLVGYLISFFTAFAVTKFLLALGIGFVVFVGMQALFEAVESEISTLYASGPAAVMQILGLMGVDQVITVILSAVSIRLTLTGLSAAGGMTSPRFRNPS